MDHIEGISINAVFFFFLIVKNSAASYWDTFTFMQGWDTVRENSSAEGKFISKAVGQF